LFKQQKTTTILWFWCRWIRRVVVQRN